jgi:hypothetical protein
VKRISSRESIHKRTRVDSIPGEKRDRESLVNIISPPPNQKKKAASSSVEPTDLVVVVVVVVVVVEEETKQNRQTEASQKRKDPSLSFNKQPCDIVISNKKPIHASIHHTRVAQKERRERKRELEMKQQQQQQQHHHRNSGGKLIATASLSFTLSAVS